MPQTSGTATKHRSDKKDIAERRRRLSQQLLRGQANRQPGMTITREALARDCNIPSGSITKDLKFFQASDTIWVSPYRTDYKHLFFIEIQLDSRELREMAESGTLDSYARASSCHEAGAHEAVMEMIITLIETGEDSQGRPWREHLIVSNAFLIHGTTDRPLVLLVYTDDGMYTLGHLVRDTLMLTKPIEDVRTHSVGWNRAYDGYSGHRDDRGENDD